MGKSVSTTEFNEMLKTLAGEYRIFAPKRFVHHGKCTGTDLIRYGEVHSLDEIEYKAKSNFSLKEILHPINQTIFYFTETEFSEPATENKGIVIFARPCDINGVFRLDNIFLHNGDEEDYYYKKPRDKVRFVMMECTVGFENCFCVSMDTNKSDDYHMAVRFGGEEYLLDIRDQFFIDVLEGVGEDIEFTPDFIKRNRVEVRLPEIDRMPPAMYDHEMWDEYSTRCIACGRCTTTCITCSCFTTTDIANEDNPKQGERRRTWASCHIEGFTDMAGGHGFRKKNGEKMRFKTLHKIYDYNRRFGKGPMCVGCGRCDDACPVYISFSNCINKVTSYV